MTELEILDDAEALAARAAEECARLAREAGERPFSVALSGGGTPRLLHRRLARREDVAWGRFRVFWGDERCVPPEDADSNFRMARETLLDQVPIPQAQVHRIQGELADEDQAARRYEAVLREAFALGPAGVPRLDVVLLGLGADGHTASLFPRAASLSQTARLVVGVRADAVPPRRVTLTLPVLNAAANAVFVVSGARKAQAVARAMAEPSADCPASLVRPPRGRLVWLLDREAASGLPKRP